MKKRLLTLLLCIAAMHSFGQSLPNNPVNEDGEEFATQAWVATNTIPDTTFTNWVEVAGFGIELTGGNRSGSNTFTGVADAGFTNAVRGAQTNIVETDPIATAALNTHTGLTGTAVHGLGTMSTQSTNDFATAADLTNAIDAVLQEITGTITSASTSTIQIADGNLPYLLATNTIDWLTVESGVNSNGLNKLILVLDPGTNSVAVNTNYSGYSGLTLTNNTNHEILFELPYKGGDNDWIVTQLR